MIVTDVNATVTDTVRAHPGLMTGQLALVPHQAGHDISDEDLAQALRQLRDTGQLLDRAQRWWPGRALP